METAIGVFAERERAEEAVKQLFEKQIPKDSIVFLTRSESEAKSIAKELGTYAGGFVGGAAGLSAGVAAATLLAIPGIGPVFALGFGAAALLGLVGAGTGAAVGAKASNNPDAVAPTTGPNSSEDSAFFTKVLGEGHSLIIVRTDSPQLAASACKVLDELGLSMKRGATQKNKVTTRELGDVVVIDVVGRIALADGSALVRDTVRDLLAKGKNRIAMNLSAVDFVDSAGLGELVRTHASVRNHGGQLKLVNPSKNVYDLLRITKLDRVLEIEPDEASALNSFKQDRASSQAAG
jgi:anti-sigma B factor antagonist